MASSDLPSAIDPVATAFFFDFDGTLAAIVDDPSAVKVEARVTEALDALQARSGGALAVVSGRSIQQLDEMLKPLRLPAAGVHGLERRSADGATFRVEVDKAALARMQETVGAFVKRHSGLLAEFKPGSVALHYRKRPELAAACLDLAARLADEDRRIRVVRGKKVVEMKLADRTKADAIAEFMDEAPFAGRRPLFAGDDLTDEDGFAALSRRQGWTIKIGEGETAAAYRMADIAAFHTWLIALARGGPPPLSRS
jgi:trehalose 6-phosphate phosphatase